MSVSDFLFDNPEPPAAAKQTGVSDFLFEKSQPTPAVDEATYAAEMTSDEKRARAVNRYPVSSDNPNQITRDVQMERDRKARELKDAEFMDSQTPKKGVSDFLFGGGDLPADEGSYGEHLGQGAASMAAGGLRMGATVLGMGINAPTPGYANPIADKMVLGASEFAKEHLDNAFLTDKQQSEAPFAKKLTSAAGSLIVGAPAMFLGPVGGVAVMGGLGAAAGLKTIDDGGDMWDGLIEGVPSAMFAVVGMGLPTMAKNVVKSVVVGAAFNTPTGILTRQTKQWMYQIRGDEDKANRIHVLDPSEILIDAITGGVMSGGMKAFENRSAAAAALRYHNMYKDWKFEDWVNVLGHHLDGVAPDRPLLDVPPGIGPDKYLSHLLVLKDNGVLTNEQFWDHFLDIGRQPVFNQLLAANHPEVLSQLRFLRAMSDTLGLKDIEVSRKFWDPQPVNPNTVGRYHTKDPSDPASVEQITVATATEPIKTAIHEIKHALFLKLVEQYESWKVPGGLPPSALSAHMFHNLFTLENLFKISKEQIHKDIGFTHDPTLPKSEKEQFGEFLSANPKHYDAYGTTDFHEFLSEMFTNRQFARKLEKVFIPMEAKEALATSLKADKGIWSGILESYRINLTENRNTNVLELAAYPYLNLMEAMNHPLRTDPGNYGPAQHIHDMMADRRDISDLQLHHAKSAQFADYYVREIGKQLKLSEGDRDSFNIRMGTKFNDPAWKALMANKFKQIWDNKAFYIKKYETGFDRPVSDRDAKSMDKFDLADDPRDLATYMKTTDFKDVVVFPKSEDLKTFSGNLFFGADQLSLMKRGTVGRLIKVLNDNLAEKRTQREQAYVAAMAYHEKFNKLKTTEKIVVAEAASHFDSYGMRKYLEKQGLMWPTKDMLLKKGLKENEAEAYLSLAQGYDYLHTMLNAVYHMKFEKEIKASKAEYQRRLDAANAEFTEKFHEYIATADPSDPNFQNNMPKRKTGDELMGDLKPWHLAQLPGFMPHIHEGAYKVYVEHVGPHGEVASVYIKGFETRWGAKNFVKRVGNNPELRVRIKDGKPYQITKERNPSEALLPLLLEHHEAYKNQMRLDPSLADRISELSNHNLAGWNKSLMKRDDVLGYINDPNNPVGITLRDRIGLPGADTVKVLKLYERYANSVSSAWASELVMHDINRPLTNAASLDYPDGVLQKFENMTNFFNYATAQISNFTGQTHNKLQWMDDLLSAGSVAAGFSPFLPKQGVRAMRNALSELKLRSARNWFANYIQPVHVLENLQWAKVAFNLKAVAGAKQISTVEALGWAMGQKFKLDDEGRAALKWATDNHVIDESYTHEIFGKHMSLLAEKANYISGGRVGGNIEGRSRATTFLAAYKYLHAYYGNVVDAYNAASVMTRMTMVNYDRVARPHMYQVFGTLGESISPFMVFRNAYLGNTYLMAKTFLQFRNMESLKPLLTSQMSYLLTAGAYGMIGAAEWEGFTKIWNYFYPSNPLRSLTELMGDAKVPDWFTFGAVSSATKDIPFTPEGFYLGGSAQAPDYTDPLATPMVPFVTAAALLSIAGGKELAKLAGMGTGATSEEVYKALMAIVPVHMSAGIQKAYNNGGPAMKSTSNEGYVPQSESNEVSVALFGSQSLRQYQERRNEETNSMRVKRQQAVIQDMVEKAVDHSLGTSFAGYEGPPGIGGFRLHQAGIPADEAYRRALEVDPDLTSEEFQSKIKKEIERRMTTRRERDAKKTSSQGIKYRDRLLD